MSYKDCPHCGQEIYGLEYSRGEGVNLDAGDICDCGYCFTKEDILVMAQGFEEGPLLEDIYEVFR